MEQPTKEEIDDLDLFSVKAIRKGKDGSLEVEFYDRFEALRLLEALESAAIGGERADRFIGALQSNATGEADNPTEYVKPVGEYFDDEVSDVEKIVD